MTKLLRTSQQCWGAVVVEEHHDGSDTYESIVLYAKKVDYFQCVDQSLNRAALIGTAWLIANEVEKRAAICPNGENI